MSIKSYVSSLCALVLGAIVASAQYVGAAYDAFATSTMTSWIQDTVTFISGAVQATITQLFQSAAGPLLLLALTVGVFYWIYSKFRAGIRK
jgi:hypothetical protein